MRTGPGMPKLHWYSVVWWAVLTSMRFSLSWCLGLVRATSPACGESSKRRGRRRGRRGRKTRQASTPPCYLTCNNHLLKLCPIPTIFILIVDKRLSSPKVFKKKLPALMPKQSPLKHPPSPSPEYVLAKLILVECVQTQQLH